mmetsp:Transcript_20353/g.52555  ORF Transcript_20353/g.52555 Transcript_20353/m.52555 type:complete len:978 (-) Transcript_20353:172-3105(-)
MTLTSRPRRTVTTSLTLWSVTSAEQRRRGRQKSECWRQPAAVLQARRPDRHRAQPGRHEATSSARAECGDSRAHGGRSNAPSPHCGRAAWAASRLKGHARPACAAPLRASSVSALHRAEGVVRGQQARVRHARHRLLVPDDLELLAAVQPLDVPAVEVDAIVGKPPLVQRLRRPHALVGGEVDQPEVASGLGQLHHCLERLLPGRDHRQAVRACHHVRTAPRQLGEHGGVVDVALDALDLRGEAERGHPLLGHLQQRVRKIEQVDARAARLHVPEDELDVSRRAAPHGHPRLRTSDPGHHKLHEHVAVGKQRLAEAVVPPPLRLVEFAHVTRQAEGPREPVRAHGRHHLEVVGERVCHRGPRAFAEQLVRVVRLVERRPVLREVPADTVVVRHEDRRAPGRVAQVGQHGRVHLGRERAPEDARLGPVHARNHPPDILAHHRLRHPVHRVEQRGDGDLAFAERLGALRPRPVERLDDVHARLERAKVLLLEVARAALLGKLADHVPVVEVVVLEVLVRPHPLRHHLHQPVREELRPLGQQVELLERHAAQRGQPRPERWVLHHVAHELEADRGGEPGGRALARHGRPLHQPLGARDEDDGLQQLGHQPGRARKHEVRLDDRAVRVPELGGGGGEVLAQLGHVHRLEHAVVRLAEEREELGVRARADGRQLELEQRELRAVHVDGDHLLGALEHVVEHIAAGGRDGEHHVLRPALEHAVVDRRVLPRDVVDDLLLADGRHDEVLRVHVVHDAAQLPHAVRAGEHVHERGARVAHLAQHAHARRREVHVRRRLRADREEEEVDLRVERQPALRRRRAHEVAAHPALEGDEVPAEEHDARREHQLGVRRGRVDQLRVEHDARHKVEQPKQQRRLALVLHLEDGEDDDGQLLDQRDGKEPRHAAVQQHATDRHVQKVVHPPVGVRDRRLVVRGAEREVHDAVADEEERDEARELVFVHDCRLDPVAHHAAEEEDARRRRCRR